MNETSDIIVAGGGLNGQVLALALASRGFHVALVGRQKPSSKPSPRAFALTLTSQRLLANLGLWNDIVEHAQPMLEIKVSDGRSGEGVATQTIHFQHQALDEAALGYMMPEQPLLDLCETAVNSTAKINIYDMGTEDIAIGDTVAVVANSIKAPLIIAADGRDSPIARFMGVHRLERDYHQSAVTCTIAHTAPHFGTAHQIFLPGGPLGILPLTGNTSSIVWSNPTSTARSLAALDDEAFLGALRPVFGTMFGDINTTGSRGCFPLRLSLAQSYVQPRIALLGDAAHAVHPLAGQGLNAGFRDIGALVDVLTDARGRGEDLGQLAVLQRYQTCRRSDNMKMAGFTDRINAIFSNDRPALRMMRNLGMGAIDAMPSIKRNLMREAAGLTGDLPSLMRV